MIAFSFIKQDICNPLNKKGSNLLNQLYSMKLISTAKLFTIFTSAAIICSCSKEDTDNVMPETSATLQIETSVLTRTSRSAFAATQSTTANGPVMGTNLTAGDKIGVSVFNTGSADNYQGMTDTATRNLAWTFDGSVWNAGTPFYLQNSQADIYAYYPYSASATNMSAIEVAPGYTDYLYGKSSNAVSKPAPAAQITLNHALSMISFTFSRTNYPGECKLNSITVKGVPADGTMDLRDGSIDVSSTTTDLAVKYFNAGNYTTGNWNHITIPATGTIGNVTTGTGNTVTEASAFHALVLPVAALPANTNTLRAEVMIDGAVYTVALNVQTPNANKWEAGKHYVYNLMLKGKELTVSTVTVNQWTQGGSSNIEI